MTASAQVPDTAQKVGAEITPVSTWGSLSTAYSYTSFAKSDCTPANAFVSANITDLTLVVSVYDGNHAVAYVPGTDFSNGAAGVVYAHPGNTDQTLTYTMPSMPINTPQLVSFDINPWSSRRIS
jgi:hypothetical protein